MEADVPMGEGGDSGSASSTYGPCGRRMCGLVGNGCQGDAGVVGEFTIRRNFTHWVFKRGAFVVPFSASSVCGKFAFTNYLSNKCQTAWQCSRYTM